MFLCFLESAAMRLLSLFSAAAPALVRPGFSVFEGRSLEYAACPPKVVIRDSQIVPPSACRRTKRRQAEVENLQEAVANAGYETSGYAGYYSSGFGGYGTGGAPTSPRGFIFCMHSSRSMNLYWLACAARYDVYRLLSCRVLHCGLLGGSIFISVSHPTCPSAATGHF